MLDGIKELTGAQELHPGGHNWPDMQIVVDPSLTTVEDNGIYLVEINGRDPVVKRLIDQGASFAVHPALSAVHGQRNVEFLGRSVPCQTIEFSDNYYKRYVTVLGKVVGIWAVA